MKKYDVVALGELLIDFTENGKSNQGNPLFEANPGGAPCNVLAMLTKLGHKTAFIGKVGEDFFGEQLRDAIQNTIKTVMAPPCEAVFLAFSCPWERIIFFSILLAQFLINMYN